tara:strand:- start:3402 stop:3938 length:537 start_codon:yes stop_codon:yes gene_type:complete
MNRKYLLVFILFPLIARDIYYTRSGTVSFFSATPIEDISAKNNQVTCVLDNDNGQVSFRIPILGFSFKNGLMQEHFNENYMESDIYPNASFKGMINDWDKLKLTKESQKIKITGEMTIRGISKEINETGIINKNKKNIIGSADFQIKIADYGIKIPKIVKKNIAEIIDINIEVSLKKK